MNKLINVLIITVVIVCLISLTLALIIFSYNQFNLTNDMGAFQKGIQNIIFNDNQSMQYRNLTNNQDTVNISYYEELLKNTERLYEIQKNSSTVDILSFLYIFITTVLIAIGSVYIHRFDQQYAELNKNYISLSADLSTIKSQQVQIKDEITDYSKKHDKLKDNYASFSDSLKQLNEQQSDIKLNYEKFNDNYTKMEAQYNSLAGNFSEINERQLLLKENIIKYSENQKSRDIIGAYKADFHNKIYNVVFYSMICKVEAANDLESLGSSSYLSRLRGFIRRCHSLDINKLSNIYGVTEIRDFAKILGISRNLLKEIDDYIVEIIKEPAWFTQMINELDETITKFKNVDQ